LVQLFWYKVRSSLVLTYNNFNTTTMEKDTFIKTNPKKQNTLILKGVTKKQIGLLKEKKLPIAMALGLLGGVGSQYAFMSATGRIVPVEDEPTIDELDDNTENNEECFDFEVPTNIEFSDTVNDEMSFAEAYKAARADVGDSGFYNWRGSSYHTLSKEEWDALSDEEKQQFFDKIQEHSDFDNGEYNKIDEPIIEEDVIEDDKEEVIDDKKEDVIDKKEEEVIEEEIIDKKDDNWEENIPDEISYDDIIYDEMDITEDTNAKDDVFVTLDEIGETDDILEGLNDGTASEEADGIAGGDTYNPEDYESNNSDDDSSDDDDLDYDDDFADDLVS
jgi:hypothetical protein